MDGTSERRDERRSFDVGPCVGAGGFGEVYQATMTSAGGVRTKVALKVLHHGLDPRSQAVQRLADEAKLLGLLDHPSILRIHDLVLLDERITLVTEYVAGADLDRCCSHPSDPLPARAVLQAGAQVAAALHAAYRAPGPDGEPLRLLHRDIKPSNVRIGRHGEVKLLDFGIAKAAGQRVAKTQTNALIGSFTYMSPERLDKEGNDDAPGDVFSLGCTLYEALAGRELFDGTIRELYRMAMDPGMHQGHVTEHIGTLPVHDGVKQVLRQMLAYDPEERPSAGELAELLEDLADDTPGLTLTRWARAHVWPEVGLDDGGTLSGRTITEMAISGATLHAQFTQEITPPATEETFAFDRRAGPPGDDDDDAAAAAVEGRTSPTMVIHDDGEPGLSTGADATEEALATDDAAIAPMGAAPTEELPKVAATGVGPTAGVADALAGDPAEPDDAVDEGAAAVGAGARWAGVAALGVASTLIGGGGAALVLLVGLGWWLTQGGVGEERPGLPAPVPTQVDPAGQGADEPGEPADTPPGSGSAKPSAAPRAAPSEPGASPAPASEPGGDDGVAAVAPASDATVPGEGLGRCGDPDTLEPAALVGRLDGSTTACLAGAMVDFDLPQVDRDRLGRLLVVDARARCDAGAGCEAYETHQRAFFEEVTRSDADMVLSFATFLASTASDDARRREAMLWASRGLELKQSWSGSAHIANTDTLHEVLAEQAYKLFEGAPRDDRLRIQARNAAVDWMNLRIDRGRDPAPALALCASVEGSEAACTARSHDVGARFVVTLISRPMGATVFIDGQQVGVTPHEAELPGGDHEVKMVVDGKDATRTIPVGAESPTRWIWSSADDGWTSAL